MPRLHLLGVALLPSRTGEELRLQYSKGWALLGYLAVERGRRHSREQLAGLLWPRHDNSAARTNLRQVLNNLQNVFRDLDLPELIRGDRNSIGLIPQDPGECVFDIDLLDPLTVDENDVVEWLLAGEHWHHRGPFLDGLSVPDSNDFEDWLVYTREHFLRREIRLLTRLRDRLHAVGRLGDAIETARALTRIEAWNEVHFRALLLLLAEDGDLRSMRRAWAELERNLQREIDSEPSAETRTLYIRLAGAVGG